MRCFCRKREHFILETDGSRLDRSVSTHVCFFRVPHAIWNSGGSTDNGELGNRL